METMHPGGNMEGDGEMPSDFDINKFDASLINDEKKAHAMAMGEKFYRDRAVLARRQAEENPARADYFLAKAKYFDTYAAIASRNAEKRYDEQKNDLN